MSAIPLAPVLFRSPFFFLWLWAPAVATFLDVFSLKINKNLQTLVVVVSSRIFEDVTRVKGREEGNDVLP